MAEPHVSLSTTSTFKFGYKVDAGQLKAWAEHLPDSASITVDHWKGDQREPTETSLKATWDPTKEEQ